MTLFFMFFIMCHVVANTSGMKRVKSTERENKKKSLGGTTAVSRQHTKSSKEIRTQICVASKSISTCFCLIIVFYQLIW